MAGCAAEEGRHSKKRAGKTHRTDQIDKMDLINQTDQITRQTGLDRERITVSVCRFPADQAAAEI
jgi:hypothetical protein